MDLNFRKKFSFFNRTEIVVLLFLLYFSIQIILKFDVLNFKDIKWSTFPRIDLLFIFFCAFFIKATRNNHTSRILSIIILLLTYFSFSGIGKDLFLPIYHYIPAQINYYLLKLNSIFLLLFILNFYFIHKINNLNFKKTISEFRIYIAFFVIVFFYPLVPLIIKLHSTDYDSYLIAIDRFIFFGHDPVIWLQNFVYQPLTEFLSFTYSFYGPFIGLLIGIYFLEDNESSLEELLFLITTALAIGYISYTLVPAIGPMFTQKFNVDLNLELMKEIKYKLMDQTRIDRDCFPSLHTAIGLITLYSSYKHTKKTFWILGPLIITIPFACVYLRYHYVVDVICGFLLCLLTIFISKKFKNN